jgi:SM-20-related protein
VQQSFESIVDSYLASNVGLTTNFLSMKLAAALKENLLTLNSENLLKQAGFGNNDKLTKIDFIRSDKIFWLDRKHNNRHENTFFNLMDVFVSHLNRTCYTGITGYEFHYALYETDTFYKKHLDQFKDNISRAFTLIMYLNTDWKNGDGGELCIYHPGGLQTIKPVNGTCVFFKSSELEHEVLLSNKPRLSITGWLRTD